MTSEKHGGSQYHWFTPEELETIKDRLNMIEDDVLASSILAELKVFSVRAEASSIPMSRLGDALGLEAGSTPLWLSNEEHENIQKLLE